MTPSSTEKVALLGLTADDLYDDDGLAYLVPVDHIIAATAAGALTVTTAFGLFIWRAFIKPSRPRRTP